MLDLEAPLKMDLKVKLLDATDSHILSNNKESIKKYKRSLRKAINLVVEHLKKNKFPYSGATMHSIKSKCDVVSLDDNNQENSIDKVLVELKDLYMNDIVNFHHSKYVAHLNCPILIPALVAEVFISSLNSSMDTWDQSTGGTFIELKLIEWTLKKLNYPVHGDGIFTSGGTQSNLMGLLLARDHYIKSNYTIDPKMDGLPADASRFKVLCSDISHFSLKKNLSLLGLGQNAVVSVAIDENFKMDVNALKNTILQQRELGNIPIAIVGTAGTTDFGSIDPLAEIATVAKENKMWFHVDAAYGGGLLVSKLHKYKLEGIDLSDSVTIDYHKTFFQPVSSSGFFIRDKSFFDYIKYHADYLNSKEQEEEGIPNMVKKSIQTTRRFDALKLWITLRVMGSDTLGKFMNKVIENAQFAASLLQKRVDFEILNQPEISAIVFRYIPFADGISYCTLNSYIRKAIFNEGKAIITSTKVNNKVYLKFTLLNPLTTHQDIEEIIQLIMNHGQEYFYTIKDEITVSYN